MYAITFGVAEEVLTAARLAAPPQLQQVVPFLSGPAAPDGTNFSGIQNADYEAAVEKASAMNGVEGCATWLEAESALFAAADIVPFANNVVPTFGAKAEFEYPGQLVPTSIRMLAE